MTNEEHSLHPRRLRILMKRSWKLLVALPAVCMSVCVALQLFDVPHYVSSARIQLNAYTMGKIINDNSVIAPSDFVDDATRLQGLMTPLYSEGFMSQVAAKLLKSGDAEKLVLIQGEGLGIQMRYLLYKVSFGIFKVPKVDAAKLSPAELGEYIEPLVQAGPAVDDRAIALKVVAVDAETSRLVNVVVLDEFMKAAREVDRKELENILELFADQTKSTQAKIDELEGKLAEFLKANPDLSSDGSASTVYSEYSRLKLRKLALDKSIESNTALLGFLKRKWSTMDPDSVASYETIEQMQKELIDFKYERLRLKQLNYADDNPGVVELEGKIRAAESFIKKIEASDKTGSKEGSTSESMGQQPLSKLTALQESILKDKYELKATEENLAAMEPNIREMTEKGAFRNYLRREIDSFSLVHADTFKRWQLVAMRSAAEKGNFYVSQDPTMPQRPINLPFGRKLIFSVFIGFACAFSLILIFESLSPKVIERGDIEKGGFKYAGRFNSSAASRAEILETMGCVAIDGAGRQRTEIVLCASPSQDVDIQHFEPLAKYLADRSKKALLVAVGHTAIPEGHEKVSTSRFAHFFQYPGGNEDLIWVLETDAFDAVKSVLDRHKSSYHTIFLFVQGAYESSIYSLSQKMADKILMLGAVGMHTFKDYARLGDGFTKPDMVYVSLMSTYDDDELRARGKNTQQKVIQKLFKKTFSSAPEPAGKIEIHTNSGPPTRPVMVTEADQQRAAPSGQSSDDQQGAA